MKLICTWYLSNKTVNGSWYFGFKIIKLHILFIPDSTEPLNKLTKESQKNQLNGVDEKRNSFDELKKHSSLTFNERILKQSNILSPFVKSAESNIYSLKTYYLSL